jgi:lipopolysaccharide assembly protein A
VATSDSRQAQTKRSRRETARTGLMMVLAVLVTLFAVLNVKQVEVNWIFGKSETPLIIVIVASLLVGILFTHFAEVRNRRKS